MSSPFQSVKVVPHKKWYNKRDGREASLYGASPWKSPFEAQDWEVVQKGYTWECVDHRGFVTIGASRRPVESREKAEEIAEKLRGNC